MTVAKQTVSLLGQLVLLSSQLATFASTLLETIQKKKTHQQLIADRLTEGNSILTKPLS